MLAQTAGAEVQWEMVPITSTPLPRPRFIASWPPGLEMRSGAQKGREGAPGRGGRSYCNPSPLIWAQRNQQLVPLLGRAMVLPCSEGHPPWALVSAWPHLATGQMLGLVSPSLNLHSEELFRISLPPGKLPGHPLAGEAHKGLPQWLPSLAGRPQQAGALGPGSASRRAGLCAFSLGLPSP